MVKKNFDLTRPFIYFIIAHGKAENGDVSYRTDSPQHYWY
jgi:hypothetical protein